MKTFEEINLIAPLQRALADEKYEIPTPIQAQSIPAAIEGKDLLGCAQTGTGKTASFALPLLNTLGKQNRRAIPNKPFALVLAPTRELAIQIGESFATYGRHLRFRQALVYGGVGQGHQVRSMKRGVHLLVATPGRLLDLMNQGHIQLDQLEMFVLDEADRMLDMGFLPDLKRIISKLPPQRQSLFFSATLPPNIIELSQRLLKDPVKVHVTPESRNVEKIEQRMMFVERGGKQALLEKTLGEADVDRVLVFTKTKRGANAVAEQLVRSGISATAIHGNKSQNARQKALESFRRRQVKVLVATDVAARGIDVDGITHVINFDLPVEPESYVHRIGRTGRAGAEGIALSFCSGAERRELRAIERLIGQKVPVSGDDPGPEFNDRRESSRHRGRRPGSTGGGSRPYRPRSTDSTAGKDGSPKRRRRPRSGSQQRVGQTS